MGLIAFNRYIRVVKPALYSRLFPSKRVARLYCAVVWIASLLLATPPLYGWGKIVYHPLFTACCFDRKFENISYAIVIVGIVFNGSTASIFYFYYNIYKTLKESTQNLNAHSMEDRAASSGRPETDIRLLKTSFTVVCVFLMTWGPISFVVVLETAGRSIPREVFIASMYLMFSSSLVNPIIYGIMNPQFRAAFERALTFRGYGNSQIYGSRWNGTKPSRQPWSLGMRAQNEPRGLPFFSVRVVGATIVDFEKTGGLGRVEIATNGVAFRVKERRKLLHCKLTRNIPMQRMQLKHFSFKGYVWLIQLPKGLKAWVKGVFWGYEWLPISLPTTKWIFPQK